MQGDWELFLHENAATKPAEETPGEVPDVFKTFEEASMLAACGGAGVEEIVSNYLATATAPNASEFARLFGEELPADEPDAPLEKDATSRRRSAIREYLTRHGGSPKEALREIVERTPTISKATADLFLAALDEMEVTK
jgi:hypothetical protein